MSIANTQLRLPGKLFFLCLPFLSCLVGHGQAQSWFLAKVLNDNNGLPQNSVTSLYFDSQTGFLWMTTEAGLVRYDGAATRVFDLRQLPPLKTVRMARIFRTLDGKTLVGNWEGEVFTLQKNLPGQKLPHRLQYIYAYGEQTGNSRSTASLELEDSLFHANEPAKPLVQNSLWLNGDEVVVVSLSKVKYFRHRKRVAEWNVSFAKRPVLLERNGSVYVMEEGGRHFCFDKRTLQPFTVTVPAAFSTDAHLFYEETNRQPLLLSGNRVYELQFRGPQITAALLATLPQVPTDVRALIYHPNRRTLFIATNTTGLHIYQQSLFWVYKVAGDNNLNANYAATLIDSNRVVTCRSVEFNLQNGEHRRLPINLTHIRSLTLDTAGHLWSAQPGRIVHFPVGSPEKVTAFPLPPDNYLQTVYSSRAGTVWVSTGRFLAIARDNRLEPQISFGKEGDSLSFYYLTENKAGELVGINNKGVYVFDEAAKKLKPLVVVPGLLHIRFVTFDDNGFCWITSYGYGNYLYHLPSKSLVKLPVDEKGYLLYSHAFIAEGQANFLIPTNKGLFRVSKENLLQVFRQPGTPLFYQYFDVSEGLLTNEFNGGCYPAYNCLPGGDVLLPALQGLVRVRTAELPAPGGYPLWVDKIETKDSSYTAAGALQFGWDERLQTWHLSVAQWNKPNQQNIFYRLDDEAAWRALPAGETKILLNELSGGRHRLQFRYHYGLLPTEFSLSQYEFAVGYRLTERPLFWLAALVVLGLLIYGFVRLRHTQLQQKNKRLQALVEQNTQELSAKNTDLEETLLDLNEALKRLQEASAFKNRLIGLVGHDMLIPIRFIANIAGHLHQHAGTLAPQTLTDSSDEIKNTAEQLLLLGENLIYWIKLQEGKFNLIMKTFNLHQLVAGVCSVHKAVMAAKNNQLHFTVPDGLRCRYDPVLIQVVLHNLLLNAHKFTVGGTITVEAQVTNTSILLSVADTGVGMEPSVVASLNQMQPVASVNGTGKERGWGMGYLLIIDLLQLAGGRLTVQSRRGQGTEVLLSLPLETPSDQVVHGG